MNAFRSNRGRPRTDYRLTHARLLEVLFYDPSTGSFTWLKQIKIGSPVGSVAGCECPRGYVRIGIDGEMFNAHRLAWFYVHGIWPPADIDHAKGDRPDNRIVLLRPATRSQNNANSKTNKRNMTGLKGVSWRPKRGAFLARIQVNKRPICLGYFATAAEAHAAYCAAAQKHYGAFANSGSTKAAA